MGSSILYGALTDLDSTTSEDTTSIPSYTPPGMPVIGTDNALYGTSMLPASSWNAGETSAAP